MHVAFVVANFAPHMGGVETHVRAVAGHLLRRGHGITVFNCESKGTREIDGIRVIGLGRRFERGGAWCVPGRGAARQLRAEFVTQGVTHVSVHTRFFPATWLGISTADRAGLPSILTEHGGGAVRSGSLVTDTAARLIDGTRGRSAIRRAGRVLAVSAASADLVHHLAGRDSVICGNGADAQFWTPVGVPVRRPLLTFAGRLVPEKGWRTFLDILGRLPDSVSGLIAGDGPDRAVVSEEIARRGLGDRVALLGLVDQETLREAFRGSVYVNPSWAAEGFQTTLLEAALSGAVLATYDVGGAKEVFASGAVGEVVRPGDSDALADAVVRGLTLPWREAPRLTRYDWTVITSIYEETLAESAV